MELPDFHIPHAEKIEWMIETNGWAIEPVPPTPRDRSADTAYAYSIGVPAAVDFPDVAVFGLTPVAANGLIGLVVDACVVAPRSRSASSWSVCSTTNCGACSPRSTSLEFGAFFGTATAWYRGAEFSMVQLIYPDRNGFMPYETGFEQRLRLAQPVIGASGRERRHTTRTAGDGKGSGQGVELAYDLGGGAVPDFVWGHGLTSSVASEDELGLFDFDTIRDGPPCSATTPVATVNPVRQPTRVGITGGRWPRTSSLSPTGSASTRTSPGGASMGCATALHAAVLAPERIRGAGARDSARRPGRPRAAQTDRYDSDGRSRRSRATTPRCCSARPSGRRPIRFVATRLGATVRAVLDDTDPERLARMFRGAATTDLPDARTTSQRIAVPTLILAWTGDPGHPVSTAARLQELIPHAELALASTQQGLATWTSRVVDFLS